MQSAFIKSLVLSVAFVVAWPTALAQTISSRPAARNEVEVAVTFPDSALRHLLAARATSLTSFLSQVEVPRYIDRWTAMYESLTPEAKAGFLKSIADGTHPRALREALVTELPGRLASQAAGAAGGTSVDSNSPRFKFGNADGSELVYKPTLPCRVADTRGWSGPVQAGKTRQVYVWSLTNLYPWSNQGGTGTPGSGDCTVTLFQSGEPVQVLANVTVVNPSNAGNVRTYDGAPTLPATSTVNFVAGQTVANAIAIPVNRNSSANGTTDAASGGKRDIGVYVDNANADIIIDVVGYFVKPSRAQIFCVNTGAAQLTSNTTGYKFVTSPMCDDPYNMTATFCEMSQQGGATLLSSGVVNTELANVATCEWNQTSFSTIVYSARARCCVIP